MNLTQKLRLAEGEISRWRQETAAARSQAAEMRAEADALIAQLAAIQNENTLAARLKAAETDVVRLKEFEEMVDEAEGAISSITKNDYGYISEVGDLAEAYMQQKAKIVELENLLAIDGLRLTQAWRQIEELKRGKAHGNAE